MTHDQAFQRAMKYCAYQDRCQKEVRTKLYELGACEDSIEQILSDLIAENFLNEERFATSYARGKFYYKDWGRIKITRELQQRELSSYCIKKAMMEIDEQDYLETLNKLVTKKTKQLGGMGSLINKKKIANFLFQKGYESDLVWETLKMS